MMNNDTLSVPQASTGLSMHHISHAFGQLRVLNDVSIQVEAGQVACLLGPSGCGKTTLLRIAAGLEDLQSGEVSIGGRLIAEKDGLHLPPEERNIGLMFQDYALFPHLNVIDNIGFGLKGSSDQRNIWITMALERMGLSEHAHHYPHELSGGQQQRIALLRALAPEPKILLLDEPFSGLDVTRRASVREQTLSFLKEAGHSALMVTHDPEEAMFMSDNLLIMDNGRLIQSGNPIDIYSNPKNAFVASLFGQTDTLRGIVQDGGRVDTPFGSFPAPQIKPGTAVDILIRPEGVSPTGNTGSIAGSVVLKVISARPIGRSSHLCLGAGTGIGTGTATASDNKSVDSNDANAMDKTDTIHARIPGIFLPDPGTDVNVIIDPAQVFVFPQDA
jgi:iron(III) transport system ATP-binding protein